MSSAKDNWHVGGLSGSEAGTGSKERTLAQPMTTHGQMTLCGRSDDPTPKHCRAGPQRVTRKPMYAGDPRPIAPDRFSCLRRVLGAYCLAGQKFCSVRAAISMIYRATTYCHDSTFSLFSRIAAKSQPHFSQAQGVDDYRDGTQAHCGAGDDRTKQQAGERIEHPRCHRNTERVVEKGEE